jgi:hypothetical protein
MDKKHTTSRNNEFHTRDANPRAPPKDMRKNDGNTAKLCSPTAQERLMDKIRP